MKFTESKLEQAFTALLANEGYPHFVGNSIVRTSAVGLAESEVLIEEDLKKYLLTRYNKEQLTEYEVKRILHTLKTLPSSELYESNKRVMRWLADGFIFKREDRNQKDIHIELIDYEGLDRQRKGDNLDVVSSEPKESYASEQNIYRFVTQLEIVGTERRIPDGIIYLNGLPVVVFEFKTAIKEHTTIHDAYKQITTRYKRDIPELFKYNAFCVISDGVNNKAGSLFAPYEFYYAWRRVDGMAKEMDGIDSMYTLVQGMLNRTRLRDIIQNFTYIPDTSKKNEKIVCRYPQYYAARMLYENIKRAEKPEGDGKGGTYFGATGSGKSFTMLFLTRLLMKSVYFSSPTIVLITDRTDLDDQLSTQFTNAKLFIGDNDVRSVESRAELRELLQDKKSGGVYLTTIHKFTEDTQLLTNRTNVICISDEAHRSQTNLDQKVVVTADGVRKSFGFAKYLHDSLPNATYVGFTGTPIDATLDVFGDVVDAYTMTESVRDEITVRIVYEGRAAKVVLHNGELDKIETYYAQAADEGANEYQIEESKKATATMNSILGDPDRLQKLAIDFVEHYNKRVTEGASVNGKAMFVCSSRDIGYRFYRNVVGILSPGDEELPGSGVFPGTYEAPASYNSSVRSPGGEELPLLAKEEYGAGAPYIPGGGSTPSESAHPDYASIKKSFTNNFGLAEEWHSRILPHRNSPHLIQSINFRLNDSLPQEILRKIEEELKSLPSSKKEIEKRKKLAKWLDKGLGSCSLAHPEMAQVVFDAFKYYDGDRYILLAWSIMPNHVHVLIETEHELSKIVQGWKSFTAKWAFANNKKYGLGIEDGAKQFWKTEYWDRFIRDEAHFENVVRYIMENPSKAGLGEESVAGRFTGSVFTSPGDEELPLLAKENTSSRSYSSPATSPATLSAGLHPSQIQLIMTRDKDDPKEMYDLLGTKEDRKELDRLFKDEKSNFKVAIVVDMWLTGFDVPSLDSIYIDKPLSQHNLIQTISRVNRKYKGKNKGLVVDYIGIKKAMNLALAKYNKGEKENFEDVKESLTIVRNHLNLLSKIFHGFNSTKYFKGTSLQQLNTLNMAAEFVQRTEEIETRFMGLVKRLKAGYDICAGSEKLTQKQRDYTHFYLAIRSIVFKLTRGSAPDTAQMNARVREMIKAALESNGVEEIFKLGDVKEQDIFDEDYLAKIDKIKLPNTKIKLLQQLLAKAIEKMKKVNKVKGTDFSKKMQALVQQYNERKESDVLRSEVYEDMAEHLTNMLWELKEEYKSGDEKGIDFEEKAFYDILKDLCVKYDFEYPEEKLIVLAKAVKELVDSQAKFPDWNKRDDIKSALKVGLILLLDEHKYPPVEKDEVYKDIFEQAENFKKNRTEIF